MSRMIQLDARLSLAYDLYDPCDLAADIGTDHAHLPAALLQRGRCQHMILTDLSESALNNARGEIAQMNKYRYLIVNDDLDLAFEQLMAIVRAEKQNTIRYFPEIEE